jgi:hypothetical protein
MTVRKVLIGGIAIIAMIEVGNRVAIIHLQKELKRVKMESKLLNERKSELADMKEFVQSVKCQGAKIPLYEGAENWVRAYIHDLIQRMAKESNIRVRIEMGETEEGEFFPKILNIKQIPVAITLESQADYFTIVSFVEKLRNSRFFIDSLSVETGEYSTGAPTIYVKFFFRRGHVGKA